ncbi:MAG: MipA/OmpV family protein [Pseudomonadota bacterium]
MKVIQRLLLALCLAAALPAKGQLTPESAPDTDENGEGLPLWEVGVGGAIISTPDYPASTGSTVRGAPLPVVIYRGKFLRLGDGSLASGRLFESERLELDLSLSGSFDAESEDVEARAGMPDLGWAFEIGPELEWQLTSLAVEDRRWKLELPVRAAFSADDGRLNPRGFVFSPQLEYERELSGGRYEISFSITPTFATQRLHDYFYTVDPEFATATRPAYDADGGYLQTNFAVGLQRRGDNTFAALGVSYASFAGSANADSPLHLNDSGWRIGLFFVRKLWASERRIKPTQSGLTETPAPSKIDPMEQTAEEQ